MYLSTIAFLTTALAGHAIAAPASAFIDPLFCLRKDTGTYCSGDSLIACGAGPDHRTVIIAENCQCEEFQGLNSAHCLDGVHKKREVAAIAGFSCRGKETGRYCDGNDLWACGASGGRVSGFALKSDAKLVVIQS
ncbi:hypothetical protein B0T16DRAFT_445560 [Cercophora newfieldiana]|uniref:Uncharacterized protein n=1 Tax=Cercophora newfieldiana TaxID=92897 RepID=A0AA40CUM6_9PEZI|nr:hypothetical protein B0T16DRAFT_445560 [Cercophora newfieldiana]